MEHSGSFTSLESPLFLNACVLLLRQLDLVCQVPRTAHLLSCDPCACACALRTHGTSSASMDGAGFPDSSSTLQHHPHILV